MESIRDLHERINEAVKPLGLELHSLSVAPGPNPHTPDTLQAMFLIDSDVAFKDPAQLAADKQFREIALNQQAAEKAEAFDKKRQEIIDKLKADGLEPEEPEMPIKDEPREPGIAGDDQDVFELPIEEVRRRLAELEGHDG